MSKPPENLPPFPENDQLSDWKSQSLAERKNTEDYLLHMIKR